MEATSDDQVVPPIITQFSQIDDQGQLMDLDMHYDTGLGVSNHVQGMAIFNDFWLFSHNSTNSDGYLLIWSLGDGSVPRKFDISCDGYRHPAGISNFGRLLAVPVEPDADGQSSSVVQFYDLNGLGSGLPPVQMPFTVDRRAPPYKAGASSAALSLLQGRYVLIIVTPHFDPSHALAFDVYESNGADFTAPGFGFSHSFRTNSPFEYDNLSCVIGDGDTLYLVGLRSEDAGASYADFADLYKVEMGAGSILFLMTRHMYTHGGNLGMLKPHFRWGATVYATATMDIYCTERNPHALGAFSLNLFKGGSD